MRERVYMCVCECEIIITVYRKISDVNRECGCEISDIGSYRGRSFILYVRVSYQITSKSI